MPNKRKSLKAPRFLAFQKQKGRCFYCESPMWLKNPRAFASRHQLSEAQAKALRCTGEHLSAKSIGGGENNTTLSLLVGTVIAGGTVAKLLWTQKDTDAT